MTGFLIFLFILLVSILYPLLSPGDPLAMIGRGTFAAPGTYVSLYDATSAKTETLLLPDADAPATARSCGRCPGGPARQRPCRTG